jgi:hypothetical protein
MKIPRAACEPMLEGGTKPKEDNAQLIHHGIRLPIATDAYCHCYLLFTGSSFTLRKSKDLGKDSVKRRLRGR